MCASTVERGSWKDTAWYQGVVNSWREYKRHKIGLVGLFLLFFFVGMALFADVLIDYDPAPINKVAPEYLAPGWMQAFDPGSVVTGEIYEEDVARFDSTEPTVTVKGEEPSQFSSQFHSGGGTDKDDNYMSLTWSFNSGDSVYFIPYTEAEYTDGYDDWLSQNYYPRCRDFIMFEVPITWEYENRPNDVVLDFRLRVTRTGDFATDEGGILFRVFVWFVRDDGSLWRLKESYPPYDGVFHDRPKDCNPRDVREGFNETLFDQGNRIVKLGVGLVPQPALNNHMNFNGSVTADVSYLQMVAYGEYFGKLGTTDKGADAWSQLMYGSRISLTVGILSTALATAVGVGVGLVAGYTGGKVDELLMRITDFMYVIPALPLMMVLTSLLGGSTETIITVIAIFAWTVPARLIRSQVLAEKNKAYVESARAIGASDTYIMIKHILPNVTPILFATITLRVVGGILTESGLSFLGLTQSSVPSWGRMLADASGSGGFIRGAWWLVMFPGLMITLLSLAFTFIGHTLDQVLNPRLRER
jgi:ABC-type dipeptide/oligopeptide/nickel transport system permease subunit